MITMKYFFKSASSNVVQSAAFAIRNLAQSNDKRTYEELKKSAIGTILFKLLKNSSTSAEVITELAWILTYFSASAESLEYLFSCGITVGFVVELFARCFELPDSTPVTTAIIRTLGNQV